VVHWYVGTWIHNTLRSEANTQHVQILEQKSSKWFGEWSYWFSSFLKHILYITTWQCHSGVYMNYFYFCLLPIYHCIDMTTCKHSANIIITRHFLGSCLISYNYDIHSSTVQIKISQFYFIIIIIIFHLPIFNVILRWI